MRTLLLCGLAAAALARRVPTGSDLPPQMGDATLPYKIGGARPDQLEARPSLIDYNPVATVGATVVSSDNMARFTVLTERLIRMEYAKTASTFEDHATIAILNRALAVPSFTHGEAGGVLTITTPQVVLTYKVGQAFSAASLSVAPAQAGTFPGWTFGDAAPGNLLGTIRGLDGQGNTPLNCTVNVNTTDNGEYNHCEWGMVSRDGWVVYDDTQNFILDADDWWVPNDVPPPVRSCTAGTAGQDAGSPSRSAAFPDGATATSAADCCNKCMSDVTCLAWVYETDPATPNCWPLADAGGSTPAPTRVLGIVGNASGSPSAQVGVAADLYGFFHGHDYRGAIADFVAVSGSTIMVPKYASGIWWSRWFDYANYDVIKAIDDYMSRQIPLDVQVLDMNWHRKNDWSGFTFDEHLYPFPADSMAYINALGLPVTMNLHDASGVNNWEALFPQLVAYLGLPADSTKVPFNIVNATVAYAVEDIVLGDLLNNKNVAFWWIDWQQGGSQGGMTGHKQNPTIWLNHLRCTDRHRVGDDTRALVLARWGGLGGHRYQVGFSGDVADLTWGNLAYQPYFSATAANVGHGFWSHDIEGPANDMEMYTRWIQVGAFSGTMRSHDRGMSGGGCANDAAFSCSIVEVWNTPNVNFPDAYMEANRLALQWRAALLPVVYNGHRAAFETGVGLVAPMYYFFPEADAAYLMDNVGNSVQYMFGPSILFSPVVTPGDTTQVGMGPGLATKTTWLPPGTWVDANSGSVTVVAPGDVTHFVNKTFPVNEIPLWFAGGAVIPYVPLRYLPTSVGNAGRQYSILGFKLVPGGTGSGSISVYEDDGATTAYLTKGAFATTTASYVNAGLTTTVTISTTGTYPELPATRSYQVRVMNGAPIASVTANGVAVPYVRFGRIAGLGKLPASSQHYYEFGAQPWGLGPVVDIVGVPVSAAPLTVVITYAVALPDAALSGVLGAISRAVYAKANLDIARDAPGSDVVDPAPCSVLASMGQTLEYLAGTNATGFVALAQTASGLVAAAAAEIGAMNSPRKGYSVALLQSALL